MRPKTVLNDSPKEIPQHALLMRRSQTRKAKGELAELAFMHKAASLGFGVAKPYGDSERYDFILDSGERFWRVQVKSIYTRTGYGYRILAAGARLSRYSAEEIDFVVVYVVPHDAWYVIPINCVPPSAVLIFYPQGCRKGAGRFEGFREAWHLMAPGADLRGPGLLRCQSAQSTVREEIGTVAGRIGQRTQKRRKTRTTRSQS